MQARTILESEGCPPCYPSCLEVPLRDVPKDFQAIVSYWQSFPGTGDVVLKAQLSDWQKFHAFQARMRRNYRYELFVQYIDKLHDLRRTYNIDGEVTLRSDITQQSSLVNWIEFQYYHLTIHEGYKRERDNTRRRRDDARRQAINTTSAGFNRVAEAYERRLQYSEHQLQSHEILLHWIEQKQSELIVERHPTPSEDDGNNWVSRSTDVQVICTRSQHGRSRASSILRNVRVSRAKSREWNTRRQEHAASKMELPTVKDLKAPQRSISPDLVSRESGPGVAKTKTPICWSRLSRIRHPLDTGARCSSTTKTRRIRSRGQPQRCQASQRPQAETVVKTRYGRISKPPVRWVPGRQ
jgi:hypothetical protein